MADQSARQGAPQEAVQLRQEVIRQYSMAQRSPGKQPSSAPKPHFKPNKQVQRAPASPPPQGQHVYSAEPANPRARHRLEQTHTPSPGRSLSSPHRQRGRPRSPRTPRGNSHAARGRGTSRGGHGGRGGQPAVNGRWRDGRDAATPRQSPGRGHAARPRHDSQGGRPPSAQSNRSTGGTPSSGKKEIFERHMSVGEAKRRIERGELIKGRLRVNPKNHEDCYVKHSAHLKRDISVPTRIARNRALEGDEVAVEVLPRYCWRVMEKEAERANLPIPSNHQETLSEALESTSIGSPRKLKSIVSRSELTRPTIDSPAADRHLRAAIPASQRLSPLKHHSSPQQQPQQQRAGEEDALGDVTKRLALLNAYDSDSEGPGAASSGVRAKAGGRKGGSTSSSEGDEEDLDDIDTDATAAAHREALSQPFMGPIEHRNDHIPDDFLIPVGKIVCILDRDEDRKFVGCLEPFTSARYIRFTPRDMRVPRMLIPTEKGPQGFYTDPKKFAGRCYTARLVQWGNRTFFGIGELVDFLGMAGAIMVETESILQENGIPTEGFSEEVLACLPDIGTGEEWQIPQAELQKRRDLRHERIFTVDPRTARDLDDALSCTALDDGTFEVGVHIADVSFFMPAGTALDKEAQHRATSTYMVHAVYPMLPRLLCENLCSLVADTDRLAYSVIWRLDAEGHKLDQWMGRTVIRSCGKLAYEHAQAVIEDPSVEWKGDEFPPISRPHPIAAVKRDIVNLDRIAKAMRKRRFATGALSLNKGKVGIKIDPETQEPIDIFPYVTRDSNRMIEEFMLLANMSVAEVISTAYPQCALLRRHPAPLKARLHTIKEEIAPYKIDLGNTDDDHACAGNIHNAIQKFSTRTAAINVHALASMLARAMQLAEYFSTGNEELSRDEWRHFALNAPVYTHFTSPIRRYPDVIVHRLLTAALQHKSDPGYEHAFVDDVAEICNMRKLAAKRAQEASNALYMSAYISQHGPFVADAVVVGIMSYSAKLYVPDYALEHLANVNHLDLDTFMYKEDKGQLILKWPSDEDRGYEAQLQVLELFTPVKVQIKSSFKAQKYHNHVHLLHPDA